jgi:hypothetical protein
MRKEKMCELIVGSRHLVAGAGVAQSPSRIVRGRGSIEDSFVRAFGG